MAKEKCIVKTENIELNLLQQIKHTPLGVWVIYGIMFLLVSSI